MTSKQVQRLPGTRDLTGKDECRVREFSETLRTYFSSKGYGGINTPILEETELFIRKAGGEISTGLYAFVDLGGNRVSLRPEFTPSIIRHFIQEGPSLSLPVQLYYCGPVFRYGRGDDKTLCQYTQVGIELIGKEGSDVDADILILAIEGLMEIGLREHQIRIGHLGVLRSILGNLGISEPAKRFIISNVQALKNRTADAETVASQAKDTGFLRSGPELTIAQDIADMPRTETRDFILTALSGPISNTVGRRTPEQIADRLLRKIQETDDPTKFKNALALISELAQIESKPMIALENARKILTKYRSDTSALKTLDQLFAALIDRGIQESQLVLDFGLARGISYYTGMVFNIYPNSPNSDPIGGGGRYDSLVKALGGQTDVPALGFAYTLDKVVEAIRQEELVTTMPEGRK